MKTEGKLSICHMARAVLPGIRTIVAVLLTELSNAMKQSKQVPR